METDINRLKVVLAEKKRTNKWLCEQLNVNPSTVSKWCTNSSQPDLETLIKISHLLDVELNDLVNKDFKTFQPINRMSDL
ncbi:helix-turn-helix transcriptional regulator [Segatella buccae]|jgi:transcriptional regulator with XRE-family HTH domain